MIKNFLCNVVETCETTATGAIGTPNCKISFYVENMQMIFWKLRTHNQ